MKLDLEQVNVTDKVESKEQRNASITRDDHNSTHDPTLPQIEGKKQAEKSIRKKVTLY